MNMQKDVLPEGFPDPMLMNSADLEEQIEAFHQEGNVPAENFMKGVYFARASMAVAGVLKS